MKIIGHSQLGKNGITENFIETLKSHFTRKEIIRISVLKSARPERSKMKEYAEEITKKLGNLFTTKIIGFTIIVKKWRKPRKAL